MSVLDSTATLPESAPRDRRLRFELERYIERCERNGYAPSLECLRTLLALTETPQPIGNPEKGFGGVNPA